MKATDEFFNILRNEIQADSDLKSLKPPLTDSIFALSDDVDIELKIFNIHEDDFRKLKIFDTVQWYKLTNGFQKEYVLKIINKFSDKKSQNELLELINEAYRVQQESEDFERSIKYAEEDYSKNIDRYEEDYYSHCCANADWYEEISDKIGVEKKKKPQRDNTHEVKKMEPCENPPKSLQEAKSKVENELQECKNENKALKESLSELEERIKLLEEENKALKDQQVSSEEEKKKYQELTSKLDEKDKELQSTLSEVESLKEKLENEKRKAEEEKLKLIDSIQKRNQVDESINFGAMLQYVNLKGCTAKEKEMFKTVLEKLVAQRDIPKEYKEIIFNLTDDGKKDEIQRVSNIYFILEHNGPINGNADIKVDNHQQQPELTK